MNSGPLKIPTSKRNVWRTKFPSLSEIGGECTQCQYFFDENWFLHLDIKTYILLILLDSRVNFLRPVSTVGTQNATRAQN